MRRVALFLLGFFVTACDSSDDYEACRYSAAFEDPRGARCPGSVFPKEEERWREIGGFVYRGHAVVPNAVVRMEPRRPTASSEASYVPFTTVTDAGGFYRIKNVPFEYDLTIRLEHDVLSYRGLVVRYYEPTLVDPAIPRTWTSTVDVVVVPPPKPGHVVTFVGSGEDVVSVSGDSFAGATITTRKFAGKATIHAIEHPEGTLVGRATSYGRVDVSVSAGGRTTAEVKLDPIQRREKSTFSTPLPAEFELDGVIDLFIEFGGPTNFISFAQTRPGEVLELPVIDAPNGVYASARARRKNGAVSETGLWRLSSLTGPMVLPFPEPPTLEAASSGPSSVGALGKGVIEHVLRPADGGRPTLHVITGDREARLPDLEALGLPRATGKYVWTARDYPKFARPDKLGRLDWYYQASAMTEPTEVVLP